MMTDQWPAFRAFLLWLGKLLLVQREGMSDEVVVRTVGPGKSFGSTVALQDVGLTIGRGEAFGYLPGEPAFYGRLTGRQHMSYFGHLRRDADDKRAGLLADRLDVRARFDDKVTDAYAGHAPLINGRSVQAVLIAGGAVAVLAAIGVAELRRHDVAA